MLRTICLVLLAAPMALAIDAPTAAPSASPEQKSVPAAQLQLDDVIHEVLAANPALGQASTLVEAQKAHVKTTGVLPDPSVTISYMGTPTPFKVMDGDPSSYRGVSVMQMFPLGGKLGLEREVARKDVAVEEVSRESTARDLVAQARMAFYDYAYYCRALDITERNHQRLKQLAEISESRYRVGKTMQQDVLRAQLEISMLLQKESALRQQQHTAAARLNTLMNHAPGAPLPEAVLPPATALPTMDALTRAAESNDPMLARELRMEDRENASLALARKDGVPDISAGYMYQQRTDMPDMYGVQVTMNLPWLHRDRRHQEVTEAELRVRAAKQGQEARKLNLAYELQQSYDAAKTARQMIDYYDHAILPQAEMARDSAQSSYTVGNVDFLTVISSYTAIYSYELDYYRQRADYETAMARMEAITGDLDGAANTEAH